MIEDDQYAIGFAEGETQRFYDRQNGTVRAAPHPWSIKTMRGWGFWDGYTPRSSFWYVGAKPVLFEEVDV